MCHVISALMHLCAMTLSGPRLRRSHLPAITQSHNHTITQSHNHTTTCPMKPDLNLIESIIHPHIGACTCTKNHTIIDSTSHAMLPPHAASPPTPPEVQPRRRSPSREEQQPNSRCGRTTVWGGRRREGPSFPDVGRCSTGLDLDPAGLVIDPWSCMSLNINCCSHFFKDVSGGGGHPW